MTPTTDDSPMPGRCGAKTRTGGFCKHKPHFPDGRNTRCKHHGGLSTGPKTAEGKAKVARNATTHGLYAQFLADDEAELMQHIPTTTNLSDELKLARLRVMRIQRMRVEGEAPSGMKLERDEMGEVHTPIGKADLANLEERALALVARLSEAQHAMHPADDKRGRLRISIDLTTAAKTAAAEVPDLTEDADGDDEPDQAPTDAEPAQDAEPGAVDKLADFD
jgi:hypothetical protein